MEKTGERNACVCVILFVSIKDLHFIKVYEKVLLNVIIIACMDDITTVKPLKSGHIGGRTLVRCREVVPTAEVG